MRLTGEYLLPGAFLCDMLPIRGCWLRLKVRCYLTFRNFLPVKYSPSWVPFQKKVAVAREIFEATVSKPYGYVKKQLVSLETHHRFASPNTLYLQQLGTALPSLTEKMLSSEMSNMDESFEHRVKWAAGSMYGGMFETFDLMFFGLMRCKLNSWYRECE